jgi:DNA-binding PadR family transcriptional regulator
MDMSMTSPLKPAALYMLFALSDHDRHGYAIMQAVRELSEGRVPIQTGSFYRHLSQLIASGLVAEVASKRPPADARRGVDYRLTPRGRQVLEDERRHLKSLIALAGGLRASRKGTA